MLGGVQLYVAVSVVFQTLLWFIFRESRAFEQVSRAAGLAKDYRYIGCNEDIFLRIFS